jgi:hypothetical protein
MASAAVEDHRRRLEGPRRRRRGVWDGGERVQVEFRKKKARKETWKSVFEETWLSKRPESLGLMHNSGGRVGETMARGPGNSQGSDLLATRAS